MSRCRYAVKPERTSIVDADGRETPVAAEDSPVTLCAWGEEAAPVPLIGLPPWLQRAALSGHLLDYPKDCTGCPCHTA